MIRSPGDQHRDTAATTNPFLEQKQHITEYSAQEIATLQSRLDKQLGPEFVSTRPGAGGGKVHYLAAEKAINLANEVFGFNGWSSSIQNVQIDFVDENAQNGKITLGLSTIVRVTIRDGTFHEDIGYGHIENCKGKAAAFEKAKKEAATDALKRALRNFGNVLGNCLYDKDYLQKVQKVKVAPSKWDADNLHRHPDYAPIKRESLVDASEEEHQQSKSAGSALRQESVQSLRSYGSAEFEDDFGGNPFDENDLSHPDEVRLDETPAKTAMTPAAPNDHAQQRQGVPRMQSMPQIRPSNVHSPAPVPIPQAPQRPSGPPRPPNNAIQPPPPSRMQPTNGFNGPQRRNHNAQAPGQNQLDGSGGRSNQSSGTATDPASHLHPQLRPANHSAPQDADSHGAPIPRQPPPDIPDGFVTGRSAELLNAPPGTRPSNAALAFNPHAETPSIRRTHGVNPGKSAPVTRQALQSTQTTSDPPQPNGHPPGAPQSASGAPPPPQQYQGNGQNGMTTPVRTNFVNPSADPSRRIGMPPSAASHSMQNRGSYRPPTVTTSNAGPERNLKRPPLSDVSNLQQVPGGQLDGAGDGVKKAKMDDSAPQDGQNGAELQSAAAPVVEGT